MDTSYTATPKDMPFHALPLIFPMLVWLSNVLTFRGELQLPILQSRGNPFALHNFRSLLHHAAHAARSTDGLEGLDGLDSLWPVVNGRTRLSDEETESCASSQRSHLGNLWEIYGILWDTSILSMDHWVLCRDLVTVREVVSRTPIWRDLWDLFSHFWLPIDLIYRSEKVSICVFLHRLDWIELDKIAFENFDILIWISWISNAYPHSFCKHTRIPESKATGAMFGDDVEICILLSLREQSTAPTSVV